MVGSSYEDGAHRVGLGGRTSEDDARAINEFRGKHPELALACINKHVTVNWATMLLDSGLKNIPKPLTMSWTVASHASSHAFDE